MLLALMAGLNGQQFAFNGYLPKEKTERNAAIKKREKRFCTTPDKHKFF